MEDPLEGPTDWMTKIDFIFLCVYVTEALLKIFALGYSHYPI